MAVRRTITKQMARRYQHGSKVEKTRMLDELCALTGWTRRHARRALHQAIEPPVPSGSRIGRPPVYRGEVLRALRTVWATLDGPCGKRLAPFLPQIVPAMERCGELELTEAVRAQLLQVSAATIDRVLAPDRARLELRGRSRTTGGSLFRSQIPVRTFADWDEARPGFFETDLVAHDGGDARGIFCQTLTLTDVCSGWTEVRALRNKAQRWVFEALLDVRTALPIPLLGLDSDNGSEFMNAPLLAWCQAEAIVFTRSRPYRKNDNCFVEQKNGAVVREAVGYLRYDTPAELEVLAQLYRCLRDYVNFFQPQMHLVAKLRQGAKISRRYDRAQTPHQRLVASEHVPDQAKQALDETFRSLNPVALKRAIAGCQDRLMQLSMLKERTRRREVRTSPDHPWRTPVLRQRALASRTS